MKTDKRRGFVLLEILPALMLLMGSMMLSGRILAHAMETRARGQERASMQAAVETVWTAWREAGGTAAIASREANGSWLVSTYPDATWLPADAGTNRLRQFVFSRRRVPDPAGWELRVLVDDGFTEPHWMAWTRLLESETEDSE